MRHALSAFVLTVLSGMALFMIALLAGGAPARALATGSGKLNVSLPSATVPAACAPAWRQVSNPAAFTPVAVTVPGPANAWAVGGSTIIRWNGSTWSVAPHPTPSPLPGYTSASDIFEAVAGRTTGEVWAVGSIDDEPAYFGDSPADVLYFDGTTWQRPLLPEAGQSSPQGAYYNEYTYYGVAAVGTGEAWAVGQHRSDTLGAEPIVRHFCLGGGPCATATPVVSNPQSTIFTAAASTAPNDVWVVGYDALGGLIEHWNGTTWTQMPHDPIGQIQAVAAQVPNEAWAAGSAGILHYDGTTWNSVSAPAYDYTGIAIQSQSSIWAVSSSGIVYGDSSSFGAVTSPSGATGIALDLANGTDLWAVGPNLLHYPDVPTFTDIPLGHTFYPYVQALACRNLVSGYNNSPPCTTGTPCYLPANNVTRGQMAKFISNAAGYNDAIPTTQQTFTDVPHGHAFWLFIERVSLHNIVAGYTTSPPCTTGTPCYLPANNVTRGQTAKFVSNAKGYTDVIPPTQQTFTDVPNSNIFWIFVERVYTHSVVGGYTTNPPCTTGTPCFLPGNNVTRGQMSKFLANAFFPSAYEK
jgi:hypothetical protein